jgi:hypothetical protein
MAKERPVLLASQGREMSDEAPKLDQLKIVPQVFLDLIARFVPGAIAIVAALLLSKTTLESWLRDTLGERVAM